MKKRKLFVILAMLVMLCLAFAGCNNSSSDDDPATVTVTYDANGHGTVPEAATVEVGSKLTKQADPSADGYMFGGWYKDAECNNAWDFDSDTVTVATTLYAKWTMQYLPGTFSVASGKTVHFATGNLVATYSSSMSIYTWGFAEHQYDYVGNAAGNTTIGSQTDGAKVDLFGWVGASGTLDAYGISTSTADSDYVNNANDTLKDDWGNIASLPGNSTTKKIWRTPTADEWKYLLNIDGTSGRTDANRFAMAKVNDVYGLILFPDGYNNNVAISGITGIAAVNSASARCPDDSIDSATWTAMESAGCTFLPATGFRFGSNVYQAGSCGNYWSSSLGNSSVAYAMGFYDSNVIVDCLAYKYFALSIRLVCDIVD